MVFDPKFVGETPEAQANYQLAVGKQMSLAIGNMEKVNDLFI